MGSPFFITLLIFIAPMLLQPILSQDPAAAPCASRLLALAPCGPFVQGLAQFPAQPCCDGLSRLYALQPSCLCLFLNSTSTLSPAFPINRTLALELPQLCSLPANSSACSGVSVGSDAAPSPASSTGSQTSLGAKNNSTVAASPVVQVAPRPTSITGFRFGRSSAGSKMEIQLKVLTAAAFIPGIFVV